MTPAFQGNSNQFHQAFSYKWFWTELTFYHWLFGPMCNIIHVFTISKRLGTVVSFPSLSSVRPLSQCWSLSFFQNVYYRRTWVTFALCIGFNGSRIKLQFPLPLSCSPSKKHMLLLSHLTLIKQPCMPLHRGETKLSDTLRSLIRRRLSWHRYIRHGKFKKDSKETQDWRYVISAF